MHSYKCSFYVAFNAIYSKIGGIASEETLLRPLKTKSLPRLLYSAKAILLNKTPIRSLQFTVQSCFSKFFKTQANEIIKECYEQFTFMEIGDIVKIRRSNFIAKLKAHLHENFLVHNILNICELK